LVRVTTKDPQTPVAKLEALPRTLEKILLDPRQPRSATTNPVVSIDADRLYGNAKQWYVPELPRMRLWTDDFSNIISILRH
jgi:hypothetical protein